MQVSLAAARRGDREAFTSLVSPHTLNLQRLAQRIVGNAEDAEDICQESLLRAFTKLEQFDGSKTQTHEFRAWLMRITANCAIDFLRRKRASKHVPLEECHEAPTEFHPERKGWGESPEASYRREEQIRFVRDAIASLPAELRTVCLFRILDELSTKEVAARMGISTIAVRVRLFRAQCQLRKMLSHRTRNQVRERSAISVQ
jgi:RNA polymerase sigma-70 factor, ECF subfamily